MTLFLSEKGQTFKYVLLTTKVAQALQSFEKNNQLTEIDKKTLSRGADLIKRIIEGAILIEGKKIDNFSPTQEGLSAYGYALSTLETLNLLNKIEGFAAFFQKLFDQLNDVKNGVKKSENITLLENFFLALGSAFRGDIFKERYTQPEEYPILRRSSNATSFA